MARIRTVKPKFFRHRDLFLAEKACGLPLRLAYCGLWTAVDREGRFEWIPETLVLDILPYDTLDFAVILDQLEKNGFIKKYTIDGKHYGFIPSWKKHQIVNHREAESEIPAPDFPGHAREKHGHAQEEHRGKGTGREQEQEQELEGKGEGRGKENPPHIQHPGDQDHQNPNPENQNPPDGGDEERFRKMKPEEKEIAIKEEKQILELSKSKLGQRFASAYQKYKNLKYTFDFSDVKGLKSWSGQEIPESKWDYALNGFFNSEWHRQKGCFRFRHFTAQAQSFALAEPGASAKIKKHEEARKYRVWDPRHPEYDPKDKSGWQAANRKTWEAAHGPWTPEAEEKV